MPYRGKIQIVGPRPDADGTDQLTAALAAAVEQGWDAPLVISGDNADGAETGGLDADDLEDDLSGNSGSVLDYRVLGYPGGAFILVVLDGPDLAFEQASLATATLGRHLTTWSPALLDYRITEVQVVPVDEPHDPENWLPPIEDEEKPRPRWPLHALLDDNLRELATRYILAAGVRSLWGSVQAGYQARVGVEDIVTSGNAHPWASELTSALGELLVRAARLEAFTGAQSSHVLRGGGDPDLAADLLQRARRTIPEEDLDDPDELDDDAMRGHRLLEDFMRDHELTWNRVPDDEPADQTEDRSDRQLRALLWAGMRALATLSRPLQDSTNAWQFLARLDPDGDQEVIRLLADLETVRVEENIAEDTEELEDAITAFAGLWLSIRRMDLLSRGNGATLLDEVLTDASAFHQLVHATLIMAGPEPLDAALKKVRLPKTLHASMNDFLLAQRVTEVAAEERDEDADPYDDMHAALEAALVGADGELLQALLDLVGEAVRLTATDANPRREAEGYVSGPDDLLGYLMLHPAEHACVITSHERDDDRVIRHGALAIVARISPAAAGEMAADLPDLTGEDPRTEPAARDRAERWVTDSLRIASEQAADTALSIVSRDAQALLNAIRSGGHPDAGWPVERVTSASAEAAAALLHAASAKHHASEVFLRG